MAITPEVPCFIIFRFSFAGTFFRLFFYFKSYMKSDLGSAG